MLDAARSASGFTQGRRRQDLASIPWQQIVGMRHRLIHAYFAVDLNRVWDTTTQYVPDLIRELESILGPDAPSQTGTDD